MSCLEKILINQSVAGLEFRIEKLQELKDKF